MVENRQVNHKRNLILYIVMALLLPILGILVYDIALSTAQYGSSKGFVLGFGALGLGIIFILSIILILKAIDAYRKYSGKDEKVPDKKKSAKRWTIFFSIVSFLAVVLIGVLLLFCEAGEGCVNAIFFICPLAFAALLCGIGAIFTYQNYTRQNDE